MIFKDRADAGIRLAHELRGYANQRNALILALPRGGLAVGFEISKSLTIPLSIIVSKKIHFPGNEELAIGAVSHNGFCLVDKEVQNKYHISLSYIDAEKKMLAKKVQETFKKYAGTLALPNLEGKIVIITDDGVATGSTMLAAVAYARSQNPVNVVIAVPVAPLDIKPALQKAADEVVCLQYALLFGAVGNFYEDFRQVGDEEAIEYVRTAKELLMK